MTSARLAPTPEVFADLPWESIQPYYDDLADRPLTIESVEQWLREWSTLETALQEAATLARIAYSLDTGSPEKEAAHLRFAGTIMPRREEQQVRLGRRLLRLDYRPAELHTMLRALEAHIALFREENMPLVAEEQRLAAEYSKITGNMTVDWDGERLTVPQLQPYLLDQDRAIRERSFRFQARPYIEQRSALTSVFDQMRRIREQIAHNAGFGNYRDYSFRDWMRFDYTPEDCERFHAAVETTFVPAAERVLERKRRALGLPSLRPWDTLVDPQGRPALRPFARVDDLVAGARRIFRQVDPVLGDYFDILAREQLLDLDARIGKRPGGYCADLAFRGRPFIFMNSVGVAGDVETLLHEAGHAFHNFESAGLPLIWQRHVGMEFAEVASMSMELLAAPYLPREHGGFYDDAEMRQARVEHLESIILFMPYMASVDAFQHWIYTDPSGADRHARDAAWLRIRDRFERGVDWGGLESERVARWYRQLHIFLYPFYYIEYGIAQLGALQIWRNSKQDPAAALRAYRNALALGGTRPLPELFAAAGARLLFDAEGMAELVELLEQELESVDHA